jgi:putative selenium metabolism protein SsnA
MWNRSKDMESLLITGGIVATLDDDNRFFENGKVYIEGDRIVDVGDFSESRYTPDRTIDAAGGVVMPGLINAHHHLYSTFARGFAPPGEPARNFVQILERLWWKLDRALDTEDVYYSALLALMDSVRAGCSTVIDHHASPSCADGSLDELERAVRDVGLSACLCYEVSDRNREGEGVEENERFIRKCRDSGDGQVTALFGLHAQMTLGDRTMERCAEIGQFLETGFHVHLAEDAADVQAARKHHDKGVLERFEDFGMAGPKSLFVHGVHLGSDEMDRLRETGSMLVVNPESNLNNAVGISPVLEMLHRGVYVGLGTDGMSSHMISQARALYLSQRGEHGDPTLGFVEACRVLLENNREICGRLFPEPRGMLAPGQLADVVVTDYVPFTPFNADTFYGHLLFGLGFGRARSTVARGRVVLDEGRFPNLDEAAIRSRCRELAVKLWSRIE